jgi:phospholipid transport system substrate-binding protein
MLGSRTHRIGTVLTAFFLILALSKDWNSHSAIQPLTVLQEEVGKALRILQDPRYKQPDMRSAQKARLAEIMDRLIDFREFSKLTLGAFWPRFTRTERLEFVDAFKAFLKDTYIEIAQDLYRDERIILLSQRMAGEGRAEVSGKIIWRGLEIPVEFRLVQRDVRWKVYDILILGISGVRIYRSQFRAFLEDGTPESLIKRIKKEIIETAAVN